MSDAPTGTAERYLDALRALGVPDAAIRRHHDVEADAPLRAVLAGELSAPTDRLLEVLAGTGVVLDLEAVAAGDGSQLAAALGRYGFAVECTTLGGDLEVVATDRLGDFVTHLRASPQSDALRSALQDRLLADAGLVAAPLVDGRTLLAERGAVGALQERYGQRLEVFATPLLGVDAPELDATARATAVAGAAPAPQAAGAADGAADPADQSVDAAQPAAPHAEAPGPAASDAAEVDEIVASADEETVAEIEDELEAGGPDVHAIDDSVDGTVDAAASSLGGGPRRTVSGSGIDEVFDEIESAAERTEEACESADDPFTTPVSERGGDDGFAGGAPERTVSETSADDILAKARSSSDFESIAEEQGADPEAVLDDAEDLPDAVSEGGEPASDGGSVLWAEEDGDEDDGPLSEKVRSVLRD